MKQYPKKNRSKEKVPFRRMELVGQILRPLQIGGRIGIVADKNIYLTDPVTRITVVTPGFIQFCTERCVYDVLTKETLLPSG